MRALFSHRLEFDMKCVHFLSRVLFSVSSLAVTFLLSCGDGSVSDPTASPDETADVEQGLQPQSLSWKTVGQPRFTGSSVCPAGTTDKKEGQPCRQIGKRVQACTVSNNTGLGYCRSGPPIFDQTQCVVPAGQPPVQDILTVFECTVRGAVLSPFPRPWSGHSSAVSSICALFA